MVNALPQMEQPNGFSPVCVRSWICRALADEKFFPHEWQLCCFGVRRGGAAGAGIDVIPGQSAVWGTAAMPKGKCVPSLAEIGLMWPFISILTMLGAVLVMRLGAL